MRGEINRTEQDREKPSLRALTSRLPTYRRSLLHQRTPPLPGPCSLLGAASRLRPPTMDLEEEADWIAREELEAAML